MVARTTNFLSGMPRGQKLEHMREVIIKAAGVWEASNAGKSPPDNLKMRALAARYGFSYEWLMGREGTPEAYEVLRSLPIPTD